MGASHSYQPPSRHNSRQGSDSKQKQKQSNVLAPTKPPLPVIIDKPASKSSATVEPQSVPAPAVALPIPLKKKPTSLPASGENSYIDRTKDGELLQRLEDLDVNETEEDIDGSEVQSKHGITLVASDDFEYDDKKLGGM